jgi:hypothetical protein
MPPPTSMFLLTSKGTILQLFSWSLYRNSNGLAAFFDCQESPSRPRRSLRSTPAYTWTSLVVDWLPNHVNIDRSWQKSCSLDKKDGKAQNSLSLSTTRPTVSATHRPRIPLRSDLLAVDIWFHQSLRFRHQLDNQLWWKGHETGTTRHWQ